MKKASYKIWVSYHKEELVEEYGLHKDAYHILYPTHKKTDKQDINIMNPVYSEMVTMWYVWKNNLRTDFVGFEHYRRHLHVKSMPSKGVCQVFRTVDFGDRTIYSQYCSCHSKADIDLMISIIDQKFGKGNPYSSHICDSHMLIANCTFLMAWKDFVDMCEYLFPLLDDFSSAVGIEGYDEDALARWTKRYASTSNPDYQRRVLSFLAERLISAWISTNMNIYNGIDVVVVHFNTPELTRAAIASLEKVTPGCHVYLFDNSDRRPFGYTMNNVTVIDNTKGQVIDFDKELERYPDKDTDDIGKSNFGSAKHCMSVDKMMDRLPDGFLLIDSDILFHRDIRPIIDRKNAVVGTEYSKHDVCLFQPFLCWINVPMLKKQGIRYFNGEKMWALSKREPDCWYDTGAWLWREVMDKKLPWKHEDIYRYMVHYGHGSWHGSEEKAKDWLERYAELWK